MSHSISFKIDTTGSSKTRFTGTESWDDLHKNTLLNELKKFNTPTSIKSTKFAKKQNQSLMPMTSKIR